MLPNGLFLGGREDNHAVVESRCGAKLGTLTSNSHETTFKVATMDNGKNIKKKVAESRKNVRNLSVIVILRLTHTA